jgi:hypothetical protein
MAEKIKSTESKSSKVGAGAAGAGGGTLLLHVFGKIPDENPFKSLLILATPTISACFTVLWMAARERYLEHKNEKRIKALVTEARAVIAEEMARGNLSEEQEKKLKNYDEEIGLTNVERIYNKIRRLVKKDDS